MSDFPTNLAKALKAYFWWWWWWWYDKTKMNCLFQAMVRFDYPFFHT